MPATKQIDGAYRNGGRRQDATAFRRNALAAGNASRPKAAEVKRRCPRNAATHGLLAKTDVLDGELDGESAVARPVAHPGDPSMPTILAVGGPPCPSGANPGTIPKSMRSMVSIT